MASPQLRLVQQMHGAEDALEGLESADPTRRVFAHWLTMLGKSPRRCKLGPTRRQAINAALVLYSEDDLLMAIEGCAADPWCAGDNAQRREYTDIEWILRNESSIERFAEAGERLRQRAAEQLAAQMRRAAQPVPTAASVEQEKVQAADARARLKAIADRMSGRARND